MCLQFAWFDLGELTHCRKTQLLIYLISFEYVPENYNQSNYLSH